MTFALRRYQDRDHIHFVTFSCFDRRPLLNNDEARILFEQTLETLRQRHHFNVLGYVLMPEHVHMLLTEPEAGNLASTLRVLKTQTSKRLKHGDTPFWERRYYDFNVFTRPKIIEKLRYIHRNPVARGLVENPQDWPWSSYRSYAMGQPGRVALEQGIILGHPHPES